MIAVAGTKIERNGRRATLAAFKIGDRAQAIALANGMAPKFEAVGRPSAMVRFLATEGPE